MFATKSFDKTIKNLDITDDDLRSAVKEVERGLHDGSLGGNLYKKRIASKHKGKRGSYRTIIATQIEERWFFLVAYAKNDQSNITPKQKEALKELSRVLLNLPEQMIKKGLKCKEWRLL